MQQKSQKKYRLWQVEENESAAQTGSTFNPLGRSLKIKKFISWKI